MQRIFPQIISVVFVLGLFLFFSGQALADLNGTWSVKVIGNDFNYSTGQITSVSKTETITIQSSANEITLTMTSNGGVSPDGAFTGFGGGSSFGATRTGGNWIDVILGSLDSDNILSGTLVVSDQYYGVNANSNSYQFSSNPDFGLATQGDVTGDNRIGIQEAIHALQVVAGQSPSPGATIVGSWGKGYFPSGTQLVAESEHMSLTFYPNNTYIHYETGQASESCDNGGGVEYGTYSFDSDSQQLIVTPTVDENGCVGLAESGAGGTYTVTINGNLLQFGDDSFWMRRVNDRGRVPKWQAINGVHGPYGSLEEFVVFLASLEIKGFVTESAVWRP